jgi:hypothetical protein
MRHLPVLFLLLSLTAISACAQKSAPDPLQLSPADSPALSKSPSEASQASPAQSLASNVQKQSDPAKFALIISGISGEETYAQNFARWTNELKTALTERLNFAADRLTILNEKGTDGAAISNAEEIKKAFAALKAATRPESRVFIFFIGHGSVDGKIAKFMIAGRDLTAEEYAAQIKTLPTKNIVVINTSSASGDFIKPLSAAGRIVVTATRSGQEQNATRFAEYFIAALSNKKAVAVNADAVSSGAEADADKNGRISVLEAFNYANRLVTDFYQQETRLVTEHALIDDNGDGTGHQKEEAGDGALAKVTYFDSQTILLAGGDEELRKLLEDKSRLEGEVEQLKIRKAQMKEDDYEAALEKLLIELAEVNLKIKSKQK